MIMGFRKFKDAEYPIPGVDTAINVLRPGVRRWDLSNTTFVGWEDDEGREPPTWEEIQEEIIREVKIYNYYLYERNRELEYPSIQDQLDMIYHDLKKGNLNDGTWISAIDKIKEKYPKPKEF